MGETDTITKQDVLLFDGVCNLCNSSVNFIIDHDPKGQFKFAALQSDFGQERLKELGFNQEEFDSLVLLSEGKVYRKSTAALRIAKKLNGLWPLLYISIKYQGKLAIKRSLTWCTFIGKTSPQICFHV